MFALKPDGTIEQMTNGGGFASRRFQFRLVPAVHAGFEKVGPGLCNAGTESKQFEELGWPSSPSRVPIRKLGGSVNAGADSVA
jgi:hypothetical protein